MKTICHLAIALVLSATAARADEKTAPAIKAAEAWLKLVDAKDYAKSWEVAAPIFKSGVTQPDWIKMITSVRGVMGAEKSRKLLDARYATKLPGAPDGEYVVIQFQTDFANKDGAIETITPMKDPKGVWRVSGYYIK